MLGTRAALLPVTFAGRCVVGWQWRLARCPLGRRYTSQEVSSLKKELKASVDKAYTPEQRQTILHLLNMATESQLDSLTELKSNKVANIMQYREQYGSFQDLNTLCQALGCHPAQIHKLCESLLSLRAGTRQEVVAKFLKPDIFTCKLQEAESIVSIVFGLKKLAWAHMDRTRTVRDWQQRECFHFLQSRYMPEMYVESISEVISQMPQADLYILEKTLNSTQKSALFSVMLHLRTVEAMLYCLLNPSILSSRQHRVYSMNRSVVGKHFDIMVGQSKTSGVDIVQRLIDDAATMPNSRIHFTAELLQQNRYQERGLQRREELCDALLQALTFYELTHF